MEYVATILWGGLELLCCLVFVSAFQVRRWNKGGFVAIGLAVWGLLIASVILSESQIVKQFVTISVLIGACVLLYRGKFLHTVLWVILSYIVIGVVDIAFAYGICAVLGVTFSEFVWRKVTYVTTTTISKLISLFVAWLIRRCRSAGGFHGVQTKWFALLLLFPCASILMILVIFFGNQGNQDMSLGAVAVSAILAAANVAILYIISSIEKATRTESEAKILKQQIALQTENYDALQQSYKLQRKATHEFEHHLQTLGELLKQQKYDTAIHYIGKLQANRTLRIYSVTSNHPVIDVILNQKHQLAKEQNIKMQVQVNDLSRVEIPTDALVVLLSNLLDNAIEACNRTDGRKEVHCTILHDDGLYISVRNTSLPVQIDNGIVATTKESPEDHGYGIPAISYVLSQLHAEYTFDYSNGWFHFVSEIPV